MKRLGTIALFSGLFPAALFAQSAVVRDFCQRPNGTTWCEIVASSNRVNPSLSLDPQFAAARTLGEFNSLVTAIAAPDEYTPADFALGPNTFKDSYFVAVVTGQKRAVSRIVLAPSFYCKEGNFQDIPSEQPWDLQKLCRANPGLHSITRFFGPNGPVSPEADADPAQSIVPIRNQNWLIVRIDYPKSPNNFRVTSWNQVPFFFDVFVPESTDLRPFRAKNLQR